jgi:mono/diheme cytochrome c family protein
MPRRKLDHERVNGQMAGFKGMTGNRNFTGLLALGTAALAIPLAAACANPVASAEPVAVEVAAPAVVATQAVAVVEAPAAAPAEAGLTAEQVAQGRQLFNDWSCSACHVLTDANGHGHIGPSLDGNTVIDKAFVVARVSNGQGQMPGFGGLMTPEQIDVLSSYIMQAKL